MRTGGEARGEAGTFPIRLLLLVLIGLLFASSALAQDALILIQHDRAGPNPPTADYVFAEWIRWPADQLGRNNRILSLATGLDLQGEFDDMNFKAAGDGRWKSGNAASLEARGYFAARSAYLGSIETTVVGNPHGAVSPSVRLLGLDSPDRTVKIAPVPASGLVVYEAEHWDDAIGLARRIAGRTLIVEYPPDGTDGWSRYWTRGRWPSGVPVEKGVGVPGLIRARSALALLLHPDRFAWQPTDAGRWGGPNRWLEHGHSITLIVLGVGFGLTLFIVAWAIAQVMNEDRGPFVSELLVWAALFPASLVLAGAIERFGGLEEWPFWLALASLVLYGASSLGRLAARRFLPEAHPLWVPCLVGFATLVAFDPLWSDLSGRFGLLDLDVPGDALGAFVAYLTGVVAFAKERWFGRTMVAAVLLWGVTERPWWVDGHPGLLVLPAVAWLAAEALFRPGLLVALALLPTGVLRIVQDGVAWNAAGLLRVADERDALNLWLSTALLVSPQWLGTLGFAAVVGLVGNRFLAYRLRKLLRLDPRLRALPWTALGTLALGTTEPLVLPAAPIVAFGALIALAYDGLRANA